MMMMMMMTMMMFVSGIRPDRSKGGRYKLPRSSVNGDFANHSSVVSSPVAHYNTSKCQYLCCGVRHLSYFSIFLKKGLFLVLKVLQFDSSISMNLKSP